MFRRDQAGHAVVKGLQNRIRLGGDDGSGFKLVAGAVEPVLPNPGHGQQPALALTNIIGLRRAGLPPVPFIKAICRDQAAATAHGGAK